MAKGITDAERKSIYLNVKIDAFRKTFMESEFEDVNIVDGKLIKCELISARLKSVKFFNCDLSDTSFRKAKIEDVIFENCIFSNTKFAKVLFDKNIIFKSTTIIQG
ncbi:pentapeptide repeat-containing protein [Clostridium felsineum]|uniref:pentapeptide repeat-containing protein n=1 Tax=Clostridium felsineum TaxID=36839 RepID=UPI00098C0007|nr:pentapeptide repeat-containing protein [Clostridium felsineum]URZ04238.1 hypothetical protein CLAUR_043260 [Clostridium felsineum]